MNTKNNRRSQDTRERIRQSLLSILKKEDILDVTVSELCAAAQINRSTFYSHYDGVADIMEEIMLEIGKDLLERFNDTNYDEDHPFSLDHLIVILHHIQENQDFYRAYFTQSTTRRQMDWAFGQLLERFVRPMMHRLSVEDAAIEYYFAFFKAGFVEVISFWLSNGCNEAPETVAGRIKNVLNHPSFEM